MNLDAVDLKILTALQQDGRISNLELADKAFLLLRCNNGPQ